MTLKQSSMLLKLSQDVIELMFIMTVLLANFTPSELFTHIKYDSLTYSRLSLGSELIMLLLIISIFLIYIIIKPFGIKKPNQDNINLIRAGVIFYSLVMLLFSAFEAFFMWVTYSSLVFDASLLDQLGVLSYAPSFIATLLFPYLRMLSLLDHANKVDRIGFFFLLLAYIANILLNFLPIILIGQILSKFIRPLSILVQNQYKLSK